MHQRRSCVFVWVSAACTVPQEATVGARLSQAVTFGSLPITGLSLGRWTGLRPGPGNGEGDGEREREGMTEERSPNSAGIQNWCRLDGPCQFRYHTSG